MNKFIFTPEQYNEMCRLIDGAIAVAPNWAPGGHKNVLPDMRKILSNIKCAKVFAPGVVPEMEVGAARVIERYEMDVVQYNTLIKHLGWARHRAKIDLMDYLQPFHTIFKNTHMETVGDRYTTIVVAAVHQNTK